MSETKNITITKVSPFYESDPVGYLEQEKFINAVIEIQTSLNPADLLKTLLEAEDSMGRKREIRWGPRVIDLDLLLYNDLILKEDDLIIPHPRMHERMFVLRPLSDIFPGFIHPELQKGIGELVGLLGDGQKISRIE